MHTMAPPRTLSIGLALMASLAMAGGADSFDPSGWPTLSLKLGQEGTLDGVKVKFIRVIDDSRCPESANCYWDGAAVAEVEVAGEEKTGPVYVGIEGTRKPIYLDAEFSPANKGDLLQHLRLGGRALGKNSALWAIRVEPSRRKTAAPIAPSAYVLTLALQRR